MVLELSPNDFVLQDFQGYEVRNLGIVQLCRRIQDAYGPKVEIGLQVVAAASVCMPGIHRVGFESISTISF
jgi:hypothetical protein